jgi:alpha-methylacyl-CoA racemase
MNRPKDLERVNKELIVARITGYG